MHEGPIREDGASDGRNVEAPPLRVHDSDQGALKQIPLVNAVQPRAVVLGGAHGPVVIRPLDQLGSWTLMAIVRSRAESLLAVFEDHAPDGEIVFVGAHGPRLRLPSTLVSTGDRDSPHRWGGYPLAEVMPGQPDVLRGDLLRSTADPDPAVVADLFPPIRRVSYGPVEGPNAFVGTPASPDVMPLYYDPGRATPRVNPLIVAPAIELAIQRGEVDQGLVGGWLPIIRTAYSDADGRWEQVTFADLGSRASTALRVWYRFARIEAGLVTSVRYVDTYLPYPTGRDPAPARFYGALYRTALGWRANLHGMAEVSVPDAALPDRVRHGIALEMITRNGARPRYGIVDRAYGGAEHDGFQDTLTTSVECMLEWGLFDLARRYLDDYLTRVVRDDGSLDYRGPEIGQYGRMLTLVAQYVAYTADAGLAIRHERKVEAITRILLDRRRRGLRLSPDDPGFGLIAGRHEADISFDSGSLGKYDYERPYFSNTAEGWRGLRDLGRMWKTIGTAGAGRDLEDRGDALVGVADAMRDHLLGAVERSWLTVGGLSGLPLFPGAGMLHTAAPYRSRPETFDENRVWSELLHSGALEAGTVSRLLDFVAEAGGSTLGMFGNRSRVVSFMAHRAAYGMIQHNLVREVLLLLWAQAAHLHTAGTWMALECVDLDRDRAGHLPYCAPGQLTVPLIVRWMLLFSDPITDDMWLAKATPRDWLMPGRKIELRGAPTRWGRLSFEIAARPDVVEAVIQPPPNMGADLVLRLRLPLGQRLSAVLVNGVPASGWNQHIEDIRITPTSASPIRVTATLQR